LNQTLTVAAELGELERVRGWVDGLLVDAAIGGTDRTDIELVLSEALSNVVRHTFAGRSGSIEITVTITAVLVTIVIIDDGPPWDGARGEPDPDGGGGYGVQLIEDVMDVVQHRGLEPAGNRLTLEKRVGS
jgi:anti-sigma regulatory factor (Ser/Thr protein kinase)